MVKPLSEQLADLSVRAKAAEDAAAAAQKEAHDKIVARKEQARAAATAAVEKVNQEAQSARDSAARNWNTVKAKIAADTAEDYADEMESEASFAIDYAIASVEQAKLAVLDALDSRVEAEQVKQAV